MTHCQKLASVFRCLFWRKTRDTSSHSDERRLLLPSPSVDSIFKACSESAGGFSNYCSCGVAGDQKLDHRTQSDCAVNYTSSSKCTVIPDIDRLTVMPISQQQISPSLADRFVLVVAADMDETERLDQQVNVLCQHLQAQGIHYVLIKSTSTWPVLSLTPNLMGKLPPLGHDSRSLQDFVWGCFRRASKVLMVITPGYLRYADAYTGGAGRELTFQQKLMRKIQEKLKEEFFSQKRAFRIWPVILHELKANRNHLPSFLSSSVFYWFPYMQGMENVMEILRKDLSCPRNKVKRSI